MTELASQAAPVRGSERIEALDVLRGVAVLGILVMNVQSFAMPFAAYSNPSVFTDGGPVDLAFWAFAQLFAEQKFMTIFSLLFGAGVALMLERLERRRRAAEEAKEAGQAEDRGTGKPVRVARVHYRRAAGLILIGLAHAYLLWYGDILVTYGICALALYPLRRVRPSRLLAAGILALLVAPAIAQGYSVYMNSLDAEERAVAKTAMLPSEEAVDAELEAYRGGWLGQMAMRAQSALMLQTAIFVFFVAWRAGGLMLVGMALYKWGVVTAERPPPFYRRLALWGFALGFPLVVAGTAVSLAADFGFRAVLLTNSVLNYFGSLGVAMGYIALVMLWCPTPRGSEAAATPGAEARDEPLGAGAAPERRAGGWWRRHLGAVGRMALTNYLLQTILCVFVFYGYGLGLFGHVGRAGQWIVVLAVWAVQLLVSPWWLERFRFGPFEWLWRSMTYLSPQPFRRADS